MNYTLHQLQIFSTIARYQSITQAAQHLHMTQPAVSIQLKNFQNQFDIPLTEVIGRQLYITDFGKEILVLAERIIGEMEAIQYKTMAYKGMLTGRLKISCVSTGKYIMPYLLSDFMKMQPGIDLELDVTNRSEVLDSLVNNQVDFGLVSILPDKLNVDSIELMQNKLFVVGNRDREFTEKSYNIDLLNELPMIFREKGSGTRMVMERFISENELPVNLKMELRSNEAVKQALLAGLGYSVMPLIGIKNELGNGSLQIIPMKDFPITSTWNLVWLSSKKMSPVAEAFLAFLKLEKQRIIEEKFGWYDEFGA
ncbi:MAG TPA: LysR family transcriptional regulator [Fluviicola sp.]|nr:LysR family transcriptional regulator [Fluviicola sp.]